jgi:hypothetical protein
MSIPSQPYFISKFLSLERSLLQWITFESVWNLISKFYCFVFGPGPPVIGSQSLCKLGSSPPSWPTCQGPSSHVPCWCAAHLRHAQAGVAGRAPSSPRVSRHTEAPPSLFPIRMEPPQPKEGTECPSSFFPSVRSFRCPKDTIHTPHLQQTRSVGPGDRGPHNLTEIWHAATALQCSRWAPPPPTLLLQLTGASPFSLPLRTTGAYPIHHRPPHASTAVKRHRPRPELSPSCRTSSRVNLRPHKFAPDLRSPGSPHLATGVVTGSRTIAASQRAGRHHTGRLIGHGPCCRTHRADGRGLNSAHLARDCFPFLKIRLNT